MILKTLQLAYEDMGTHSCEFHYITGPRNKSALICLQGISSEQLRENGAFSCRRKLLRLNSQDLIHT